jgi:hypothetical protein
MFIPVIAGSRSSASGAEDVSHAVQEGWDPRVLQSTAEGGKMRAFSVSWD